MHLPEYFEERDYEEIGRLINSFPLAILICNIGEEVIANHIPLIFGNDKELIGHIAKSNPLHEQLQNNAKILVIFRAEDAYISPNYYPTKQETHRHVPTWNYQAVHINGKIVFTHSKKEKIATVGKMTKFFERALFGDNAWKMSDAPKDFMEDEFNNLVAFKINVEKITAKSKLSQNRDSIDYKNVINVMDEIGKSAIADRMKKRKI